MDRRHFGMGMPPDVEPIEAPMRNIREEEKAARRMAWAIAIIGIALIAWVMLS